MTRSNDYESDDLRGGDVVDHADRDSVPHRGRDPKPKPLLTIEFGSVTCSRNRRFYDAEANP